MQSFYYKLQRDKVCEDFGCEKFIYCSDAGLGSAAIREFNHMGQRAFIVTQSIKKLKKEYKEAALDPTGFKCISNGKIVDISKLSKDTTDILCYKEIPYESAGVEQLLIVTYSTKYARYQKTIREQQVERARKMVASEISREIEKIQMILLALSAKLRPQMMAKLPIYTHM